MKNKRSLLFSLLISVFCVLAFIPREDGGIEKLVTSLQRWTDNNPQEKVYLHTDKPYYALGDTIWFKAYVTVGSRHQLSGMSGALYVELLDPQDSMVRSLKLPLITGTTYGDFTLDEELPVGSYRLRAYTQWMRNAGEDYFFDRTIIVGSIGSTDALAGDPAFKNIKSKGGRKSTKEEVNVQQVDVQFFPESGSLVSGIASRVGFKAVGPDGNGVAIKGMILDDLDKEIIDFETLYAGMGNVVLKPQTGRVYRAKVVFPDSSMKVVELPKVLESGYVLGIYQTKKDSVLVRINASSGIVQQKTESVNLVVQSGGELVFTSVVKVSRSMTSIWLNKALFPSGIAQFSLFNSNNEPLNERVAFIRNQDRMDLKVSAEKQTYKSREPINLNVSAKNSDGMPTGGSFSVSVIDESKVPFDDELGHTIFSDILLNSDLKGFIETPNYYFHKETEEVDAALDNLMLTQGYRRFDWKAISADSIPKPQFAAEGIGTIFSGKVLGLNGKPQQGASVMMMSLKADLIKNSKADMEGRFRFDEELVLTDSIRITFQAKNQKNNGNVALILDSVPKILPAKPRNKTAVHEKVEDQLQVYIENSKKLDSIYSKNGQFYRVRRLKEVNIKARKIDQRYSTQGGLRIPEGLANLTIDMSKEKSFASMESFIRQKLSGRGIRFNRYQPALGPEVMFYPFAPYLPKGVVPMHLILDGRKLSPEDAVDIFHNSTLDHSDIAKIDVVLDGPLASQFDGPAIMFYTKADRFIRKAELNVINLSPRGFNKVKSFYNPKYDRGNTNHFADLRSTVYWNPNLRVYATGKTTFSYFNADGPGTYKVIVEGINAAGELARTVYRYEVSAGGPTTATANTSSPMVQGFVKAVDSVRQRLPVEKVYLHTDKSYYNLGDTLWFKSYLMNGTGLAASSISGLLYVELLNDSADVVRRISVPVTKGLGWAQIPLPRTIFHEGAYTLRAYTNWMQNFGEDYFFTRRFYLGIPIQQTWLVKSGAKVSTVEGKDLLDVDLELSRSDLTPAGLREVEVRLMEGDRISDKEIVQTRADGGLSLKYELKDRFDGRNMRVEIRNLHKNDGNQQLSVPLVVSRNQAIDLQFLPEGGHMVAGLSSVVGFKALGEDGKGIQVEGEVIDSKGIKVSTFASFYKGMGSFEFTPQSGEVYTARLLLTGAVKNYPLPLVKPVGTVINVRNVEEADSIEVSILTSDKVFNPADSWFLTALSGGRITYMEPVSPSALTHVISKRQFPSGLTRFTLLKNRIPLNERLVFVDHLDRLQIGMETDQPNYYKRDSVSLAIYVKDADGQPVKGNFSLAVTDDTQVRADSAGNYNIGTTLLLNTELKGMVETPGYYLNRNDEKSWKALDNLMLTQGWTNYQWADIFNKPEPPAFEPELKLKITGTVTNIFNKPIKGAQMLISSQKPAFLASTLSDTAGRYRFDNLPEIDSGSFFIQARTPKGRSMNFGEVTVESFKPPVIETRYRDQIAPWYVDTDPVQLNYVKNVLNGGDETRLRNSGIALKEVKVHAKKVIKGAYKVFREPDMAFDEQDIKESAAMSLYQILRQKLPGFKVVSEEGMPTAKFNKYIVDIFADGNAIPIRMNSNFGVADLLQQLNSTMIASFVGIAVYYSKQGGIGVKGAFANANLQAIHAAQHKLRSRGSDYYLHARTVLAQTSARQYEFATIHITTKFRTGGVYNNNPDFATLRPLPIMHPQEFYSPGYGAAENADKADYRATVYWAPDIMTDSQGKAIVSFYTADIPGTYTLNIQGSDMKGSLGSGSSKLKIITQVK